MLNINLRCDDGGKTEVKEVLVITMLAWEPPTEFIGSGFPTHDQILT